MFVLGENRIDPNSYKTQPYPMLIFCQLFRPLLSLLFIVSALSPALAQLKGEELKRFSEQWKGDSLLKTGFRDKHFVRDSITGGYKLNGPEVKHMKLNEIVELLGTPESVVIRKPGFPRADYVLGKMSDKGKVVTLNYNIHGDNPGFQMLMCVFIKHGRVNSLGHQEIGNW